MFVYSVIKAISIVSTIFPALVLAYLVHDMKNTIQKYSAGLTLFEVVIYLALAGVFLSVAVPTSLNIISITQNEERQAGTDQQFITLLHGVEALVRTNHAEDISNLVAQYSNIITTSSITTSVTHGLHTSVVSVEYANQIYSYVYEY